MPRTGLALSAVVTLSEGFEVIGLCFVVECCFPLCYTLAGNNIRWTHDWSFFGNTHTTSMDLLSYTCLLDGLLRMFRNCAFLREPSVGMVYRLDFVLFLVLALLK